MSETMRLSDLLTNYADGDGIGWPAEFAYLRTFHAERIAVLTARIAVDGEISTPVTLGYDGRIWDGHHRLAVAQALGYMEIPVEHMTEEQG